MAVILKIGGSEVTDKKRPIQPREEIKFFVEDYVRYDDVRRYAHEILDGMGDEVYDLVLTHGAGAVPHYLVEETKASAETIKEAARYTSELFCALVNQCGLKVRGHDPSKLVRNTAKGLDWTKLLQEIERDRKQGFIPVTHGTLVESDVGGPFDGHVVLSGDMIPVQEAAHFGEKYILFTSDQKGIYDRNPAEPDARLLRKITPSTDVSKYSIKGREKDISGGPLGKVKLLQWAAKEHNITSYIFSAIEPGNLKMMLSHNLFPLGTVVTSD